MHLEWQLILACWAVFLVTWGVTAIGVKKDNGPEHWMRRAEFAWIIRVGAVVLVAWTIARTHIVRLTVHPVLEGMLRSVPGFASAGGVMSVIAVMFCAGGVGFAVWSRLHLGRNWSSYPTTKEHHELVTSGPYAFVRHPIYTGMLAAAFGSVLAAGGWWFLAFLIALAVFLRRIPVEERFMAKLFPDVWPAYKKRTKALIPFIW